MSDFKIVKLIDAPIVLQFTGGINPRGIFSNVATYATGDSVSYNGASYVALTATTGNLPTNNLFWQLLAAQGDVGPEGPQGPPGTTFAIPELATDPVSPVAGDTWVKRTTVTVAAALSHTLLQIGLTAPGAASANEYKLKYKTASGAIVGVTLT